MNPDQDLIDALVKEYRALPTAVQNALAEAVAKTYQTAYQQRFNIPTLADPVALKNYREFLATPEGGQFLKEVSTYTIGQNVAPSVATLGAESFARMEGIENLSQAGNLLVSSIYPTLIGTAQTMGQMHPQLVVGERLQTLIAGALNQVPMFQPSYVPKGANWVPDYGGPIGARGEPLNTISPQSYAASYLNNALWGARGFARNEAKANAEDATAARMIEAATPADLGPGVIGYYTGGSEEQIRARRAQNPGGYGDVDPNEAQQAEWQAASNRERSVWINDEGVSVPITTGPRPFVATPSMTIDKDGARPQYGWMPGGIGGVAPRSLRPEIGGILGQRGEPTRYTPGGFRISLADQINLAARNYDRETPQEPALRGNTPIPLNKEEYDPLEYERVNAQTFQERNRLLDEEQAAIRAKMTGIYDPLDKEAYKQFRVGQVFAGTSTFAGYQIANKEIAGARQPAIDQAIDEINAEIKTLEARGIPNSEAYLAARAKVAASRGVSSEDIYKPELWTLRPELKQRPSLPSDRLLGDWTEEVLGIAPGEGPLPAPKAWARSRANIVAAATPATIASVQMQAGRALSYTPGYPENVMSEEEAFAGNLDGPGVSFPGGYAYVRNPPGSKFITTKTLLGKYPNNAALHVGETFEGVVYHELSHQLQNNMKVLRPDLIKGFEELFNARVKGGKTRLANWAGASAQEEFSQAYAAYSTLGPDALRSTHPEYVAYFESHASEFQVLEKNVTVVDLRDPSSPRTVGPKGIPAGRATGRYPLGLAENMPANIDAMSEDEINRLLYEGDAESLSRAVQNKRNLQNIDPATGEFAPLGIPSGRAPGTPYGSPIANVQLVHPQDIRGWSQQMNLSSIAGTTKYQFGSDITTAGPEGNLTSVAMKFRGRTSMTPEMSEKALTLAQSTWETAIDATSGSNPREWMAQINTTINAHLNDFVKKYAEEMKSVPVKEGEMGSIEAANHIKVAAKSVIDSYIRGVGGAEEQLGASIGPGGVTSATEKVRDQIYGNINLRGAQNIEEAMQQNPTFRTAAQAAGYNSAGGMAGGRATSVEDAYGNMYNFGGEGQGGGFGGRNIWGQMGNFGKVLYGSYIAKRMWTMAAGQIPQEVTQYGKTLQGYGALTYAASGGTADVGGSDMGYTAREEATKSYMAKGAFQEMSGFGDVAYSMTGSGEGVARMATGLEYGMGIAAVGAIGGAMLGPMATAAGMTGLAGVLGGVATVAPLVGLGVIAGFGAMEIHNALMPNAPLWTVGGIAADAKKAWDYQQAMGKAQRVKGYDTGVYTGKPVFAATDAEIKAQMTDAQRWLANKPANPSQMDAIIKWSTDVAGAIGQPPASVQQGALELNRILPGGITQGTGVQPIVSSFINAGQALGYDATQYANIAATMGEQWGYTPGSTGYAQIAGQMAANPTAAQIYAWQTAASNNARYGGMLSPYGSDANYGNVLAQQYKITTQGQAQGLQSLLAAGNQFGMDSNSIIGYATRGKPGNYISGAAFNLYEPQPYTFGQSMAAMAQQLGPVQSQYAAQLGVAAQSMGVPTNVAMGMYSSLGLTDATGASQVQNMWDTARNFSTSGVGGYAGALAQASTRLTPNQQQIITGLAPTMARMGINPAQGMVSMANQVGPQITYTGNGASGYGAPSGWGTTPGWSDNELYTRAQAAQGDFGAYSYGYSQGWSGFTAAGNLYTNTGAPIINAGGQAWGNMVSAQAQAPWNNPYAQQLTKIAGPNATTSQYLQAAGMSAANANIAQNGFGGYTGPAAVTAAFQNTMAGYQLASAGISMQSTINQQQMNWGSGTWDNPAPGSMYALQDQMKAMQYQQSLSQFAYQGKMMNVQNQFAIQQEDISQQRMQVGQQYQNWTMGFNQQTAVMQRGFTREAWQFQEQQQQQQYGWNMEDINEQIRYSSGRQRQDLIKQKERTTLEYNQTTTQTGKVESQQETLWSRQDEQYKKQVDYVQKITDLDTKQFKLNQEQRETYYKMDKEHLANQLSDFKKQKALQDEMDKKQREFTAKQLELQLAAAGVQAASALAQIQYNKDMMVFSDGIVPKVTEAAVTIAKNDPTVVLKTLGETAVVLSKVPKGNLDVVNGLLDRLTADKANIIADAIRALNGVNNQHLAVTVQLLRQIK